MNVLFKAEKDLLRWASQVLGVGTPKGGVEVIFYLSIHRTDGSSLQLSLVKGEGWTKRSLSLKEGTKAAEHVECEGNPPIPCTPASPGTPEAERALEDWHAWFERGAPAEELESCEIVVSAARKEGGLPLPVLELRRVERPFGPSWSAHAVRSALVAWALELAKGG